MYTSSQALAYYAAHGAALFPIPYGSKAPHGIVKSFAHDWSKDPAQWESWHAEHKCNFGLVAGPSRLAIADIDVSEVGIDVAWQYWCEWFQSRGLDIPMPQFNSPRGGWHVAFQMPDDLDAATLRQVPLIGAIEGVSKKAIVDLRIGNGYVVAAGSFYDGTARGEQSGHYRLRDDAAAPYPLPAALIDACRRAERTAAVRAGIADPDHTEKVLHWMAERDCFESYDDWYQAGMILRAEFGDDPGFALWQITNNGTCSAEAEAAKWQSFATGASAKDVKIGTLRKRAKDAGCPYTIGTSLPAMLKGIPPQTGPGMAPVPTVESPSLAPGTPLPVLPDDEFPRPPGGFTKRLGEVLKYFDMPDYLWDGILQKRFCYAMTGPTGTGKTAVAMLIAAHVATGRSLCGLDVEKGQVIYFAGENPTDVQMRWLGLTKTMGLDPDAIDIHMIEGVLPISKVADQIRAECEARGLTPSMVVVDTSAAYFEGDDDNGNVQMGDHARMLRALTLLPGGPCVLVLCHPTKGAKTIEEMIPRGGGAFINEVDGNIGLAKGDGGVIGAQVVGKFRGPEFTPLHFGLHSVRDHPRLVDRKGKQRTTVIAQPVSDAGVAAVSMASEQDDIRLLRDIYTHPRDTHRDRAPRLGCSHTTVGRRIEKLAKRKLVDDSGLTVRLTAKGQKELNGLDVVHQGAPGGASFPVSSRP